MFRDLLPYQLIPEDQGFRFLEHLSRHRSEPPGHQHRRRVPRTVQLGRAPWHRQILASENEDHIAGRGPIRTRQVLPNRQDHTLKRGLVGAVDRIRRGDVWRANTHARVRYHAVDG